MNSLRALIVIACLASFEPTAERLTIDCERPSISACAPATPEQADIAEPRHHRPRAEPSVAALMAPKLYRVTLGTSVSTDASVGVA
jgi:hypothetical protein